jgi:hypothetical protein
LSGGLAYDFVIRYLTGSGLGHFCPNQLFRSLARNPEIACLFEKITFFRGCKEIVTQRKSDKP